MRRGDVIVMADATGDFTGKSRPALVVQADAVQTPTSILVAPITSQGSDAPLVRVRLDPGPDLMLERTSYAQLDKLTSIRRVKVGPTIGRASPDVMRAVDRALMVILGLT